MTVLLLLACLTPAQTTAAGRDADESELLGPAASAAHCTYLTLILYDRQTDYAKLLAEFRSASSSSYLDIIGERLRRDGIYSHVAEMDLAGMSAWTYPAVVELQSKLPYTRHAIYVGERAGKHTLIDPNPFGRLSPWSASRLAGHWTGRVLLTSPVPIRVENAWRTWLWCSVAFVIVCILVCWRRLVRRSSGSVSAAMLTTLVLMGCTESREPPAQGTVGAVTVEPKNWTIEDTRPVLVKQVFVLTNSAEKAVDVISADASCGCMAVGLPTGIQIGAKSSIEFELGINLSSSQRGSVRHSLSIEFSDGGTDRIEFYADVKHGVYPDPPVLKFTSAAPDELVVRELRLLTDDEFDFEILDAAAASASDVTIDNSSKTVRVTVLNDNRAAFRADRLTVTTTHPYAKKLRIPMSSRFELSWKTRPTSVFLRERGQSDYVERSVTITSLNGTAFSVTPSENELFRISPATETPSASQDVLVRMKRPTAIVGPSKRPVTTIQTTLPDVPEIDFPFIFFR